MRGLLSMAVALLLAGGAVGVATMGDEPDPRQLAYAACTDRARDNLRAPATAQFPKWTEEEVLDAGNGFILVSHVDSQNTFGALVRTKFACSVKPSGDGWSVDLFDFLEDD